MSGSPGTISWLQDVYEFFEALDMAWKQFQYEECVKNWSRVNPKPITFLLGISVSTKSS